MDLDALRIADFPDVEIVSRMRETNYEKFKSLVRMHLSFELDLNTDEFDLPCHEIVYEDKGKLKKWNRMSKKQHKAIGASAGCGAYSKGTASSGSSPTEGLQQQIDAGFMFHLQEIKEFLLQEKNVTQEGLFRKTGSASRQNELRLQIQNDKPLDLTASGYSAHDCATVFKGYLAELPEPLLTDAHYPAHLQIAPLCLTASANFETSSSGSKKPPNPERLKREQHLLNSVQLLLLLLPLENRQLTQHIIGMLNAVAKHSETNKMTAENLATLFAPHLICPRNLPPEALHYVAKRMSSIIAYLIRKGDAVFEVPAKLSTDIRAYFLERKRKKTMSPEHTLDESISDISTVNTVYTFVDREKTAAAHTANNTDTELAQLYAHIQSMPESSKKRRLIKQFNKQNGQGTPLQLVVMNRLKNSEASRSAKSIGDSIKKHIFHKSLMSRTPKRTNPSVPISLETPNLSSSKNPKIRVLFQSPAPAHTPRASVSSRSTLSSNIPLTLASKPANYTSMTSTLSTMSSSSSKQHSLSNNSSPYSLKKHPLQKSVSSSSLLTNSSYQPNEEGIVKICGSSSSSSCAGSSCSSDDFVLQVNAKPSLSAPVSRQTSSDLKPGASYSSSSSVNNCSAQHFKHIDPNCCVTPLKIISEAAKNLICVAGGNEKKSVAWDEAHLLHVDEFSNPTTPINRTTTGSDLKSRYKSEPNLSHLMQDKLTNETTDGAMQITPICKNKSLTRKLMKGVSMGNLKFAFGTPETTKRLVRSVSATIKRQAGEAPTLEASTLLQSENSELDLNDETFEDEPDDHVSKDDDDYDDYDDGDENNSSEENEVYNAHTDISMFNGGGSSSSSELPGASVAGYQHLLHNNSLYRNIDLITSTPSLLLGRRSMSPITKSTQRMPKAMQESIMTPRSRKPVMMVTNPLLAGSSDQNLTACQPDLTSFREQDEEDSLTGAEVGKNIDRNQIQLQNNPKPLNIDEDALDGYSELTNKQHQDLHPGKAVPSQSNVLSNALTSNFKEYLLSRSVLTASPVDSSFSSQPDDFASPHDVEDLDTSLSTSLLYCLDGNRPDEDKNVASEGIITITEHKINDDKSKTSIPSISNIRFNSLSTNPFIIINNARKRAATSDSEKIARPANSSNSSIANASISSSSSSSSHTSINTTVTSGTKNTNKENYEQSQGYLITKKVLITGSDFPGETSF